MKNINSREVADSRESMTADTAPLTVIVPNKPWFHIPVREIWHYRDLLRLLVKRNFVASYKQTVLGPLWYIVGPLFSTLVMTVVFGRLAKLPTDGLPKALFYMCGQLGWGYFARCMGANSSVFTANVGLFSKVYFPRLIVPIATSISAIVGIGIQFATFGAFWSYFKFGTPAGAHFGITAGVLLIPLCLLQSAVLGMGMGLWFSALSAKYRDVGRLGGMLTQVWRYATPIIWPLSLFMTRMPTKWQWLPMLNPMTWVVECFRVAFLGKGTMSVECAVSGVTITVLVFVSGVMAFNRVERTFVDTV